MIKSIMSKKVATATTENLLRDVIALMDKNNYKEIPVVDGYNKVIGSISYFDILNIIRFRGDSKVSNFMNPTHTIHEDSSEDFVLDKMLNSGLTGLPVVDKKGVIKGFVSDYDIIKNYMKEPALSKLLVSDSNVKSVKPVTEDANLGEVKNIMNFNKRDRLPVVDKKGKFVGTILLIDLLRTFYSDAPNKIGRKLMKSEISKLMDVSIEGLIIPGIKTTIDSKLRDAMKTMIDNNLKGLIVVNSSNEPIGVLDRCSVLKTIQSVISKKGIDLEISGEVPNSAAYELRTIVSNQLRLLPRDADKIKEIKIFIKRIHDSRSEGKVEMNMNIIRDGKNINIKKTGFDLLLTLVDCLDTAKSLMKQSAGK
ncbi:MAG: CBS domain-containing protein [Nanoarchaeota archaeon]|nr:CBS domain-containing protein [Nanoarchaeota archaeon]